VPKNYKILYIHLFVTSKNVKYGRCRQWLTKRFSEAVFSARLAVYAERAMMLSTIRHSVRLSHGWMWISQKRLKLGLCNIHRRLQYYLHRQSVCGI